MDGSARRALGFLRRKWDVVLFCVGVFLVVLALGMAVARYEVFPYTVVRDAAAAVEDWHDNWRHYLQIRSKHLVSTKRTEGGVTRHDPAAAFPGYTFLVLYRDGRFGAALIDMEGKIVHRWDIAFSQAFPDPQHLPVVQPDFDTVIHGAALLPDGDVILIWEGVGAVRIDRCSKVVWSLADTAHHQLDYLPNGETLIGVDRVRTEPDPRYPQVEPGPDGYFLENSILRLRPDGTVAEEHRLMDILYDSGWAALMFSGEESVIQTEQPTHHNDVEMLRPEMAAAFPMFGAGDVMLSLRNNQTILVVDGETWKVKWTMTGPFLYAHDPDFLPNGHILLFDNRRTGVTPRLGDSRIIEIDPATRDIVWSYQGSEEEPFYTPIRGMQQQLPNGNVLVVEAQRGRVFEVTREAPSRIVWEYVNLIQDGYAGLVTGAERIAPEQAAFVGATCE
jgi:Arylsulfotransferase (ASST)